MRTLSQDKALSLALQEEQQLEGAIAGSVDSLGDPSFGKPFHGTGTDGL